METTPNRYMFYITGSKGEIAVEDVCGRFHIVENTASGAAFHCCVVDKLPVKFKRVITGTRDDVIKAGYEHEVSELLSSKVVALQHVADGCASLSAAAKKMREYADELEALEKEGFCLSRPVNDGLAHCRVPIKVVHKRKYIKKKGPKHNMSMRDRKQSL